MAHELKPVMNNIIHNLITNLEALPSLSSPSAAIQAVKEKTEPSLTKNSGVKIEISIEAKSKMNSENSA